MEPSESVGRNEPCPCGSGRKFKACCQGKVVEPPRSRTGAITIAIVGSLVVLAIGKAVYDGRNRKPATNTPVAAGAAGDLPLSAGAPMGGGTPQPPGPVPPGKVWSREHGHWHDAPPGQVSANAMRPAPGGNSGLTPQPPGPAPAGKVWSPEHGHWHDAPGEGASDESSHAVTPSGSATQPPGPAPAGKVWSAEHGHWHDAPPEDATAITAPPLAPAEIMPFLPPEGGPR